MNNPKVTVLMPVYNAERYLEESIKSILRQTYSNIEFLIINDGSTDNSLNIIKHYQSYDNRIIVVNNKQNLGIINTLNKGLHIASGKYIARMDADDISLNTRIEKQVRYLEEDETLGLCGSDVKILNKSEKWRFERDPDILSYSLLFKCNIAHPTVMLRKDVIYKYSLFYDEKFIHAEDYELWTRFIEHSRVGKVNEILLLYRIHEESVSRKNAESQMRNSDKIRENLLNKIGVKPNHVESELHKYLSINQYIYTNDNLEEIKVWLEKLIRKNQKECFFNPDKFENYIRKRIELITEHFNEVTKIINYITDKGLNVYIWGSGTLGKRDLFSLTNSGIEVKGFVDSNQNLWEKEDQLKIYNPQYILSNKSNYIFVSTMYWKEVYENLKNAFFEEKKNYFSLEESKLNFKLITDES